MLSKAILWVGRLCLLNSAKLQGEAALNPSVRQLVKSDLDIYVIGLDHKMPIFSTSFQNIQDLHQYTGQYMTLPAGRLGVSDVGGVV